MMLVSVDPHSQSVFVLSIPRDLCLGPCEGHSSRINEVYKRKGMEELQRTIRNVTGLFVDHWIKVNFYGVESIIDALGGVRVQVRETSTSVWCTWTRTRRSVSISSRAGTT